MRKIRKDLINKLIKDPIARQQATQRGFKLFFIVYFHHYIKYEFAPFHNEIINIIQDRKNNLACITAFRGSGKSTIITTVATLWSILGVHQKKFVLIVCQTKAQAKLHMMNLRTELENNLLLRGDLGPFQEEKDDEWSASSLVFSQAQARITIASMEQSVRGMRHRETRPDLIILDDIEDVQSVKTLESRDKTFDWFTREIIPLGDLNTQIIVVGNLLHEDSLVMRLKTKIKNTEIAGIYREYPLLDKQNNCLWKGKFPTERSIENFRKSIISTISWQREYLLKIVPDEYQVVQRDWIQYYDHLPRNKNLYVRIIIGVDPAISEKTKADFSAIVCGLIMYQGEEKKLYILPNPVNEHLSTPDLIDRIKAVYRENEKICDSIKLLVESIAFQEAIVQFLQRDGYSNCEGIKVSEDKRTRLATISHRIKIGDILFPRTGAEQLIAQIVGFGNERHDDLMDAFTIVAQSFSADVPYRFLILSAD